MSEQDPSKKTPSQVVISSQSGTDIDPSTQGRIIIGNPWDDVSRREKEEKKPYEKRDVDFY